MSPSLQRWTVILLSLAAASAWALGSWRGCQRGRAPGAHVTKPLSGDNHTAPAAPGAKPTDEEAVAQAVSELLRSAAGTISGKQAWDDWEQIRRAPRAALARARELIADDNLASRLLGMRILLEFDLSRAEGISAARRDGTPEVLALASDTLFLGEHFAEWQSFVAQVARALSVKQMDAFSAMFGRVPPRPELPAGLTILNLDRGIEPLTIELLRQNAALAGHFRQIVADGNRPEQQRVGLLDALNQANVVGQVEFLLMLGTTPDVDRSVRWEALVWLANHNDDPDVATALREKATRGSDDPLAPKVAEVAERIAQRDDAPRSARQAEELAQRLSLSGSITPDLARDLRRYLAQLSQERDSRPDARLLQALLDVHSQFGARTYNSERERALIRYLRWNGGRK